MRLVRSLVGLLVVLMIGYVLFDAGAGRGPEGASNPQQAMTFAGIQSDLRAIAQAERLHLVTHGTFAPLAQLEQDGSIPFSCSNRRGYRFVAEIEQGKGFRITATPTDPERIEWPTFTIDDSLQIQRAAANP